MVWLLHMIMVITELYRYNQNHMQECTLKFAFEVPQSVIDSFEKCTLKLDYNTKPLPVSESENYDYFGSMSEHKYIEFTR